ncbi:YhgE/Pip family protein [Rathayibacter soli]|uniref:YhgE/Pip family protein n=1 Tax=Rathayibacter soli TaxID=3144168 RepID=UPI0027E3E145|nr:YhgE/Pip family protein [Glaciibacter superstes]
MKIPQMIAAELRRLTSTRMAVLALLALTVVPLIYAGLYLWANQDPYAKLDQIPAAIVVDDTGAIVNSAATNYGTTVANQLVKDGSFAWSIVSSTEATHGVNDSKYDFVITFPTDFSEALASASTSSPHQATVTLTTNDANSYLASTIGTQAAEKIRTSIVQQVNEQAASQFLLGLSTIRGDLVTAAAGAQQLADGAAAAQSGASALASGTAQLASGSAALSDGLGTLSQKTADLPTQTAGLASGAQQVAAGDAQLAQVANQAGAVSQDAATRVPQARADLVNRITAALTAQGLAPDQASSQAEAIVTQYLDPLGAAVVEGNSQVQAAVGKVDQLSNGANQVAAGAGQLAAATPALTQGIQRAASGAAQLAAGSGQAASGASALDSGLGTLTSGLTTLHDGLQNGIAQIPNSSHALQAKQAQTIANPVHLDNSKVTSAGTYGAGLAPFFVALAAWIGIYALFLIVKPVSRRAITALHSPLKVTLAGWLTPSILGVVQMVTVFIVVAVTLGFNVSNPLGAFGLMVLASATFTAIILALNVWLGSVGQFLGLVLMVLQLVTAGGTFPWQTLPGPLVALHHALPMGFAVDGLRQLMYGGNLGLAWSDAGVLAAWGAVALVLAAIGVVRMTHFRTLRDLQPSLIG